MAKNVQLFEEFSSILENILMGGLNKFAAMKIVSFSVFCLKKFP